MTNPATRRLAFLANGKDNRKDGLRNGKNNVRRLYELLTDSHLGDCNVEYSRVMTDVDSETALIESLTQFLSRTRSIADTLIFFFSGHGNFTGNDRFYIQCGNDMVTFSWLIDKLEQARIPRGIILLDACNAGAAFSQVKLDNFDILASSRKNVFSWELEDDTTPYSVFTHLLCEAIETGLGATSTAKNIITVDDLARYVNKQLCTDKYKEYRSVWGVECVARSCSPAQCVARNRTQRVSREVSISNDLLATYCYSLRDRCNVIAVSDLSFELNDLYVPLRLLRDKSSSQSDKAKDRDKDTDDETLDDETKCLGELLSTEQAVLVLGDPGSGKTTLLGWLAAALAFQLTGDPRGGRLPDGDKLPKELWVPVLVQCQDIAGTGQKEWSLLDILQHAIRKSGANANDADRLATYLFSVATARTDHVPTEIGHDANGIVLLVDGLDAIANAAIRKEFCEALAGAFADDAAGRTRIRLVITSRPVGYQETTAALSSICTTFKLSELCSDDKKSFIHRWVQRTADVDRQIAIEEELLRALMSDGPVDRLTSSPWMLTTFALVKKRSRRVVERRYEFYREAINVLLDWRPNTHPRLAREEVIPQLQYVAFAMCVKAVQRLSHEEFVKLLREAREKYRDNRAMIVRSEEDFLSSLEANTGLVVSRMDLRGGQPTMVYEFRHAAFQEYLAGTALVDGYFPGQDDAIPVWERIWHVANKVAEEVSDDTEEREWIIPERWTEALRLAVAACRRDEAIRALKALIADVPDNQTNTVRARACLAARCLADDPIIGRDDVKNILLAFAHSAQPRNPTDIYATPSIVSVAEELARTEYRAALLDVLGAQYALLPAELRNPLFILSGPCARPEIPATAADFQCWLQEKLQLLFSDDPATISVAAFAIQRGFERRFSGAIPRKEVDRLYDLMGSANDAVDDSAASILRDANYYGFWVPGIEDIRRLIAAPAKNPELRDALALSAVLGVIAARRFAELAPLCVSLLYHPSWIVRGSSAWAVGELRCTEPVEKLIHLLSDPITDVRRESAVALGKVGEASVSAHLKELMHRESEPIVRAAACEALGELQDCSALATLGECLNDASAMVRSAACWSLGRLRAPEAVDWLMGKVDDVNAQVRMRAVDALGLLGNRRCASMIGEHVCDAESDVRLAAIRVLSDWRHNDAVPVLAERLVDMDWRVRDAAAKALARIRTTPAIEALLLALQSSSSDEDTRAAAAGGLGEAQDRVAVVALCKGLDDPADYVKWACAKALSLLRDKEAVEPLVCHIDVSNRYVRAAIVEALGRIGQPNVVESILACVGDQEDVVRQAAVMAINGTEAAAAYVDLLREQARTSEGEIRASYVAALGATRSEQAVDKLMVYLKSDDPHVQAAAATALGVIGDRRAVGPIGSLLSHPSDIVKASAVGAIGMLKAPNFTAQLVGILRSPQEQMRVRHAVAEALGEIGDASAGKALLEMLTEPDWMLRDAAVCAIGKLCDRSAVPNIIHSLGDCDRDVRVSAAKSLGQIGDPAAVDPLIRCLVEPNSTLRAAAAESLGKIRGIRAVDPLLRSLRDINKTVRLATVTALRQICADDGSQVMRKLLLHDQEDVRRAVVGELVAISRNPMATKLLAEDDEAQDFDELHAAWIDPKMPISEERVRLLATKLGLDADNIRHEYAALAADFHLILSWQVNGGGNG